MHWNGGINDVVWPALVQEDQEFPMGFLSSTVLSYYLARNIHNV